VFVILGLRNYTQKEPSLKIPWNHQVLIWFSGLRGAVAFALGVTFLEHPVFATDVKGVIFGTTEMVVVITVLVLGGLTPYMLKWLNIVTPNDGQDLEHQQASQDYQSLGDDDEQHEQKADSKVLFSWLQKFDAK
jgi:sodium/hydrogen exchanger 8